ncbi:MAG: ATP-dependent serine protease [Prevotellaceae bacterium]|jgi:hypothetical protein|nr:ATP-dependent serine protease [Prevotellaceae bacterium]
MGFITNRNLIASKHETMAFTGCWLDSLGTPAPSGSWMIYGKSGSGKTSFALQLSKYLSQFDRILFWSIEQGNTASFHRSWMRTKMGECGKNITVADENELLLDETHMFDSIVSKMNSKKSSIGILVIDSVTPLRAKNFDIRKYESLRKRLKNKLLIWISHEKMGLPDTKVGDYILKMSEIKMHCKGFKVFINTRTGDKLHDFVIWEEGAKEYFIHQSID